MVRVYSSEEVHAALPWQRLAEALQQAFTAGAEVPVRHAHALGGEDALLLMPAWDTRWICTKLVTVMPGNEARGVGTVQATCLVMDRATGEPVALLDGEAVTLRRTAATSALAARHLARPGSTRMLVVGSGRLAEWMARAHAALNPGLAQVQVWGRRPAAAQALVQRLATCEELARCHVQAVADLQAAVAHSDLVTVATTACTPVIQGAWLRPGQHLDLVGSFKPTMREVDDAAVQRAHVVVDTYGGALQEAGDLVQPIASGLIDRSHVQAELAELLRGERPGRSSAGQITLFKSVGTALEDLAATACVVARAEPRSGS